MCASRRASHPIGCSVEKEHEDGKDRLVDQIAAKQLHIFSTMATETQIRGITGLALPKAASKSVWATESEFGKDPAEIERQAAAARAVQRELLEEIDRAVAGYPTDSTYGRRKKLLDSAKIAGVRAALAAVLSQKGCKLGQPRTLAGSLAPARGVKRFTQRRDLVPVCLSV
eukprot:SAG22_NODE_5428_length_1014_cov_1.784699_2_plen_171_part_00